MKKSSLPEKTLGIAKPVENGKLEFEPAVSAIQTIQAGLEVKKIKPASILKLISGHEKITLGTCNGKTTIAQAKKVFNGHIDPAFKDLGLNKPTKKTKPLDVEVYELQRNANIKQMFNELNSNINALCLTQAQIVEFAEKKRYWLCRENHATFFPFEYDDVFFVADAFFSSINTLQITFIQLNGNNFKWKADDHHRLIVPQLQTVC